MYLGQDEWDEALHESDQEFEYKKNRGKKPCKLDKKKTKRKRSMQKQSKKKNR